jgi:glycosyltransferase involved in cell wall biosynthesis
MEKIQLAAAELNQAQQLGKVTNQSQLLQISNDLARLNVKQSILDLEAAIAAKDIKAIEAGTAKLNADLGILGALTGQEVKLRDIESILKDIVPKDLINLKNLDDALAKLRLLGSGIITPVGSPTPTGTSTPTLLESLAAGSFAPVVGGGYSSTAGNYASSGFPGSDRGYSSSGGNTIVVNTGIGDPNAIAEAIDQVLTDAAQRGTLRSLVVA